MYTKITAKLIKFLSFKIKIDLVCNCNVVSCVGKSATVRLDEWLRSVRFELSRVKSNNRHYFAIVLVSDACRRQLMALLGV